MLASLSNKAILTKARAMYGSRLTEEDYRELTHKYSVGEAVAYLKKETHYRGCPGVYQRERYSPQPH